MRRLPLSRRVAVTDRLADALSRTALGRRVAQARARLRRRTVPRHWSHWFGVVPPTLVAVLVVSGVLLTVFYRPSADSVVYSGPYAPLRGIPVSQAFDSVMQLSFEVPGGLLLRQVHHWAALALPAALCVQLAIVFFTGGFRRPRRAGWFLLFGILILALATGWTGYALPDDLLSGTGLRITEGVALGIPVVGTWVSAVLFGGSFPGDVIERLAPWHIVVLPLVLGAAVLLRSALVLGRPAPLFPSPARDAGGGRVSWPWAVRRAIELGCIVAGLIVTIAATVTIAPVWLNGPSDPGSAGAGSQPDWYTGFLDGALRLVPPGWEVEWLGRTWTLAVIVPLGVVTVFLLAVGAVPLIAERVTRDRADHEVLDRPRNAATRTAVGVAGLAFIGTLWGAASADLIAVQFRLSLEAVVGAIQVAIVVGPVVAFSVARRIALGLQLKDREIVAHGFETGRIVRLPGGEYVEVHAGGGAAEAWRLGSDRGHTPEPRMVFPGDAPRSGGTIHESRKVDTP